MFLIDLWILLRPSVCKHPWQWWDLYYAPIPYDGITLPIHDHQVEKSSRWMMATVQMVKMRDQFCTNLRSDPFHLAKVH